MIPERYYNAFKSWVKKRKLVGVWKAFPDNDGNLPQNSVFQQWLVEQINNGSISRAESLDVLGVDPMRFKVDEPLPTIPSGVLPTDTTGGKPAPAGGGGLASLGQPEVITIGGYDFALIRGVDGSIQEVRNLGASKESSQDVSPDTAANIAWQREQLATDRQTKLMELARQHSEQYTADIWRGISETNPLSQFYPQAQPLSEDAKSWDAMKAEVMAGTDPTSYFDRYLISHKENPYVPKVQPKPQGTKLEEVGRLLNEYKVQKEFYQAQIDATEKQLGDDTNPLLRTPQVKDMLTHFQAQVDDANNRIQGLKAIGTGTGHIGGGISQLMADTGMSYMSGITTAMDYMNNPEKPEYMSLPMETKQALTYAALDAGYGENQGGGVAPEPSFDIPDWMQSHLEKPSWGVPAKGLDATKWPKLTTPSGQSWAQLSPGQQGMWSSWAKVTEGAARPGDLYASMKSQLPQNLSLGKTWASARKF